MKFGKHPSRSWTWTTKDAFSHSLPGVREEEAGGRRLGAEESLGRTCAPQRDEQAGFVETDGFPADLQ